MIGHTLSAAGAVEAAFSLMTMREGVIPPTINYDNARPGDRARRRAQCQAAPAEVGTVLSNSFGFGGQNTCLVMAREPAKRPLSRKACRDRSVRSIRFSSFIFACLFPKPGHALNGTDRHARTATHRGPPA